MEERTAKTWDDFEKWIKEIEDRRVSFLIDGDHPGHISKPIFRGHGDCRWTLETSLERSFSGTVEVRAYARLAGAVKPSVETLTGRRWIFDDSPALSADRSS